MRFVVQGGTRVTRTTLAWVTAIGLSSCGSPTEEVTTTTTTFSPWTTEPMPEPTLATSTGEPLTTSSDTDTTDPGSTTGHPTDTATPPDFGEGGPDCNGKIDILFAFNRTWDTEEFWPRMDAALTVVRPMMIEWFANFDTHWMVAMTTPKWGLVGCEEECAANDGATCEPIGPPDFPCEPYTDGTLDDCDNTLGAGAVFPVGFSASNTRCELAGGKRYIESSQTEDLLGELECITQTGWTNGDGATTEPAMVEAFSPLLSKLPDSCNLGFLRDDALLLIVLFSPYLHTGLSMAGLPEEWASKIYEAKGATRTRSPCWGS